MQSRRGFVRVALRSWKQCHWKGKDMWCGNTVFSTIMIPEIRLWICSSSTASSLVAYFSTTEFSTRPTWFKLISYVQAFSMCGILEKDHQLMFACFRLSVARMASRSIGEFQLSISTLFAHSIQLSFHSWRFIGVMGRQMLSKHAT